MEAKIEQERIEEAELEARGIFESCQEAGMQVQILSDKHHRECWNLTHFEERVAPAAKMMLGKHVYSKESCPRDH